MSSAIDRLVAPGKQSAAMKKSFHFEIQGPSILQLPPAEARFGLSQCSIALAESRVPDRPKFFIKTAPLPKDSPDGMPVLTAPVCPIADKR
jgi:hypothetical protein